jgi:hypothetical protein
MTVLAGQYFLNHRLKLDEIEWQVRELIRAGYEGIYPHARQGLLTPFMSKDWWQAIDLILENCRNAKREVWIWDEDYFPSGLAGGRVVWENPGLISRGLAFTVKEVSGSGPFEADFEEGMLLRAFAVEEDGEIIDITSCCGTRRQRWTERYIQPGAYSPLIHAVGTPHWRDSMIENRFAVSWLPEKAGTYRIIGCVVKKQNGYHPDILNPESIRLFIEMCYQPYYDRYAEEFGKTIKGAFSDEPSPGGFLYPWTGRFPEEFKKDHGYDLRDFLPHLAIDINDKSAAVRHHYRLTQHRLQKTNYTDQIARWCREHKILCTGHLTRTEWLTLDSYYWPNELRCYEEMDIPCADPLGSACAIKEAGAYHTGLKVVSSAAHLFNREHAGSDALAVVGDEARIRDLKFMLDYQMAMGITHFVIHGLSYSLDGPRKDEVPPSLFYQHTEWKHMSCLMEYVKKTCGILSRGRHLCEIALLYPSTSLGCQVKATDELFSTLPDEKKYHELADRLLSHQKDFDLIDEVTLQEKMGENGRLNTPETYRTILLPFLKYIDQRTADALLRFARAGGRVVVIGEKPVAISEDIHQSPGQWLDSRIEFHESLNDSLMGTLSGAKVSGEGSDDIFVLRRKTEDETIIFAVNRREAAFEGSIEDRKVHIEPRGSVLLNTREEGQIQPQYKTCAHIREGWSIDFEPNHVPLNFWHITRNPQEQNVERFFSGEFFDLMQRQTDPAGPGTDFVRYACRFLLAGSIPDARLVMDESGIGGEWKVRVNGHVVENWTSAVVYDCRNLQANIADSLIPGTSPALNIITIEAQGQNRGLKEKPYLYGSFTSEYRFSHLSFPILKEVKFPVEIDSFQPWSALGYPTFSGSACYHNTLNIDRDGDFELDLGHVEDIAVVRLNGKTVKTLAWSPYRCELGHLARGLYPLTIEVTNSPGNRNRASHHLSGLLGPVRLYQR